MEFSTSSVGAVLAEGKTELVALVPDVLLWGLGVFVIVLGIGVAFAAFNRARRQTVGAVGGGRRR